MLDNRYTPEEQQEFDNLEPKYQQAILRRLPFMRSIVYKLKIAWLYEMVKDNFVFAPELPPLWEHYIMIDERMWFKTLHIPNTTNHD